MEYIFPLQLEIMILILTNFIRMGDHLVKIKIKIM